MISTSWRHGNKYFFNSKNAFVIFARTLVGVEENSHLLHCPSHLLEKEREKMPLENNAFVLKTKTNTLCVCGSIRVNFSDISKSPWIYFNASQ